MVTYNNPELDNCLMPIVNQLSSKLGVSPENVYRVYVASQFNTGIIDLVSYAIIVILLISFLYFVMFTRHFKNYRDKVGEVVDFPMLICGLIILVLFIINTVHFLLYFKRNVTRIVNPEIAAITQIMEDATLLPGNISDHINQNYKCKLLREEIIFSNCSSCHKQ